MTMIHTFELLPAVDVKDGRAVRLAQGELSAETAYGNPLEVALEFQTAGAEWIHLVDLDAAFGRGENSALLAEVIGALDIKVQLSGGIRDHESLTRALATGCNRINLSTAALENPEWVSKVIAEHGEKIAVGLDLRGHTLAARGSTDLGGDLFEAIERLERDGCQRYVVTDVTKDGTLQGPNLTLLREVSEATKAPIVASGGIANLEDIAALISLHSISPDSLGVEGAIVGKALYAGAFTLQEALALTKR
jgi:phosphoribosylformimino-5-aminoimidazole carboxamide ribotide isomerase/phosphoribosylanthranilate isomerase